MTMRILIALDDTAESVHAAHQAVGMFNEMPDVHYLVINVTPLPIAWAGTPGFGTVMPLAALPPPPASDPKQSPAGERLAQQAREAGIPAPDVVQVTGDAATEICTAADTHNIDLIVVGTHHKNILQRLLDPSVTAEIVHASRRPVLVISNRDAGT